MSIDMEWFGGPGTQTVLPVPTRRWTDAEWTIISQCDQTDNWSSEWVGVVADQRLFLHRRLPDREEKYEGQFVWVGDGWHRRLLDREEEYEAQFVRADDGWSITELVLKGGHHNFGTRRVLSEFVEMLIEAMVRGERLWGESPGSPLLRFLSDRVVSVDAPGSPVVDDPSAEQSSSARLLERVSHASPRRTPTPQTGGTMSACLLCQYKIPLLDAPLGPAGSPIGLCQKCSSLSCGWHGARTPPPAFLCILCDSTGLLASAGWEEFRKAEGLQRLRPRRGRSAAPGARDGLAAGTTDEDAAKDLASALAWLFSTADGYPGPFVVASLEQWLDERPSYRRFMGVLLDDSFWAVREIDTYFRSSSKAMLSDAALEEPGTVRRGPGHYGIGPIRSLWDRLNADGRRLLATAALLMVVLEIPEDLMPPPVADVATVIGDILARDLDRIGLIRSRITARQ